MIDIINKTYIKFHKKLIRLKGILLHLSPYSAKQNLRFRNSSHLDNLNKLNISIQCHISRIPRH